MMAKHAWEVVVEGWPTRQRRTQDSGYKIMEKYVRTAALLALRLYNKKVSAGVAMIWKSISGLARQS